MDIAYARKFDDVIAISQHGFDLHGFEAAGNMKWFKGTLPDGTPAYIANRAGWGSQLPPDDGIARVNMKELIPDEGAYYYDIPFRSLVPVRLDYDGEITATPFHGAAGSHMVGSLAATEGLAVLAPGTDLDQPVVVLAIRN